ncbi:DUF2088 domain-containing protein [bacterium]|nr:MAG: DUF2088 domain-containing protein [bacterium]
MKATRACEHEQGCKKVFEFFDVEATFPRPKEANPGEKVAVLAGKFTNLRRLPPPGRIAVAVGSRGITAIGEMTASLVGALKAGGYDPFVVPAMGSHGGETPEGQLKTLASLGITEETVKAPVIATSEVVSAGKTRSGVEVFIDKNAFEADAIVPINRIKPHTAFRGRLESGPAKLLAVGLGKSRSAALMHRAGLATAIPEALQVLIEAEKVLFGIAILENPYGETAHIELVAPQNWLEEESLLLNRAWELYPRLPWEKLDILVVERMGKDISGTGMDLNVIGMSRRFPGSGTLPEIGRVIALELTAGSGGNATGLGYADIVTRKLAGAVNWEKTRFNCAASGFPEAARLPFVSLGEPDAIKKALSDLNISSKHVRAAKIPDTSHLHKIQVSRALTEDLPEPFHKCAG